MQSESSMKKQERGSFTLETVSSFSNLTATSPIMPRRKMEHSARYWI